MTGYDVAKRFASSAGYLWQAANSQIYPELRKLEAEGLLDTTEIPWGDKGVTKTEYSMNATGLAAIRDWLDSSITYAAERDPARLKSAYLEMASPAGAEHFLREHISHHEKLRSEARDEINRIRSGSQPILSRRFAGKSETEIRRMTAFKIFAYQGVVDRSETEIAWARSGLELLRELDKET